MKHDGFTLIELLFTLFVIVILTLIALPSFSALIQHTRLSTTSSALTEAIEIARSKAVFLNQRTVLQATPDWHTGWVLFLDGNNDGKKGDDELLVLEQQALDDFTIRDNFPIPKQISFIGTGEGRSPGKKDAGAFIAGTIKICPEKEGGGIKLVLNRGGRLRSEKMNARECRER